MQDYWFRPKAYGYGATPSNWKGWAAVIVFVLVIDMAAIMLLAVPAMSERGLSWQNVVTWAVLTGLMAWWFVDFMRRRTDGKWAWRWGKGKNGGDAATGQE